MFKKLRKFDHFRAMPPYYNGYRLLSTPDITGVKPEIYISTTNRSAGKSTFFAGKLIHDYIRTGKKFMLLYRNKYEMDDATSSFFAQVEKLFFPGLHMWQETGIRNAFYRIFICDDTGKIKCQCGYITALASSEQVKKYSSLLSDVDVILFDEAFPENDRYLPGEVRALMSIHDSLARGGGSQARYLPVIIAGNLINLFNPYYQSLGIVDTLQLSTNFLRGNGFVVEQGFNEASAMAHKQSAFHRAFASEDYTAASQDKSYLNTTDLFIDRAACDSGLYLLTIQYGGTRFSVRYNPDANFYYVSDRPDPSFKIVLAATLEDVDETAFYDRHNSRKELLSKKLQVGMVKCRNLSCRNALLHFIAGR